MVTISRVVEKIVEENAFIQEALSRGIINYAAFAQEIKPQIELELKAKVKESAVMMSLRRLGEKIEGKLIKKPKFNKNSDILIKSDLFEISIIKNTKSIELIKRIYEITDLNKDFLTVTQGLAQITIISTKKNKEKILEILEKEQTIGIMDDLSSISTTFPESCPEETGYFYLVTRAFAWENISIIEIVSTINEFTLIINEKDTPRAFVILKELIKKNQ